jgi:hypothetical protein
MVGVKVVVIVGDKVIVTVKAGTVKVGVIAPCIVLFRVGVIVGVF